jgi:type II secretory pathway pseudopilin PulG
MLRQSPSLIQQCSVQNYGVQPCAGITLVETLVSLLIFFAVVAGVVPIYTTYRLQTLRNPVRIGAIAVSQQIMDELRQQPINTLPNSGFVSDVTSPAGTTLTNKSSYNKKFNAKIFFCEAAKTQFCDPNSRYIRVAVFQAFENGTVSDTPVYEVSTIYTKFEVN